MNKNNPIGDQLRTPKVPFYTSFFRSQMSAILATTTDFSLFAIMHEWGNMDYKLAAAFSAIAGAIVSFNLGRSWAFRSKDGSLTNQAFKYICTSATSLLLNVGGIYLITETFKIDPFYSKIIVSAFIGVFFNFLMYRYFVYK